MIFILNSDSQNEAEQRGILGLSGRSRILLWMSGWKPSFRA